MGWSHLHPALVHFVVGLGTILLLWDIKRLRFPYEPARCDRPFALISEGWIGLVLLGVGTGWLALATDALLQHGGAEIYLGSVHGKMGILVLGLATARVLGGPAPKPPGLRRFWTGFDIGLLLLLSGTALLGEWLVFRMGLGVSGITL